MLGQLLDGRYRIIQTLGAGGFGQTFIAEDIKLYNTQCVVKQLKPLATDPMTLQVARRLFDSEAQLLHRLGEHDQIPRLLAHFEEQQEFFLVQQLIDGHPLSHELTPGKRLSEGYAIALLQNILQPLSFVHQNNVIHRDIKPPNLIRRKQDGKIVLIDFGAVKQIGTQVVNAQGQTQMTVSIGTPGYMPSEQSRGSPRFSSDIYAVGMIGIQALTGLIPDQLQEDSQTAEILWRHLTAIDPKLADILDKMVRYDFRQRYHSAADALSAVQQLVTPYTPTQQSPTPSYIPIQQPSNPQPLHSPPPPVQPQYRQEIPNSPQPSSPTPAPTPAQPPNIGWGFYFLWIVANVVGLTAGLIIGYGVFRPIFDLKQIIAIRLGIAIPVGLGAGVMQWLVLRQRVSLSGQWWVLGTTLSFCIAVLISGPDPYAAAFLIGPLLGITQWLLLKPLVNQAGWWILVNTLGGWTDGGIISGAVLAWLLRKPKSRN